MNARELCESHESLNSNESESEEELLQKKVDKLLKKCNRLQQSTERFSEMHNYSRSSSPPPCSMNSQKDPSENLPKDLWENSSFHSTTSSGENTPSAFPDFGDANKGDSCTSRKDANEDTSDCDSTASSSVFYELSPSTSISVNSLPPVWSSVDSMRESVAQFSADATTSSIAEAQHRSARPFPFHPPPVNVSQATTAANGESDRLTFRAEGSLSDSAEDHTSPVQQRKSAPAPLPVPVPVPVAGPRSLTEPTCSLPVGSEHIAPGAIVVDESFVRGYLDRDVTLVELWRRLVAVREEMAQIRLLASEGEGGWVDGW